MKLAEALQERAGSYIAGAAKLLADSRATAAWSTDTAKAAAFASHPAVPPAVRLFVVTGFLGGLTTFSTFSSEAVALLSGAHYGRAALHVLLHGGGSFLLTALGMFSWHAIEEVLRRAG